jgi:hypothetical protein
MEYITILLQSAQYLPWFNVATAVVTAASVIAAATPTPKKGTKLAKAYSIIDLLAVNIGKAKKTGK